MESLTRMFKNIRNIANLDNELPSITNKCKNLWSVYGVFSSLNYKY